MEEYHQIEMNLLCGILDALPSPTVLLNREGQPAYTNPQGETLPISMDTIAYTALPAVLKALQEAAPCPGMHITLESQEQTMTGFMQVYPVYSDGIVAGALVLFQMAEDSLETVPSGLPYVSTAMREVWNRIARLSATNASVLFLGETGVGRESFARALHQQSAQKGLPFFSVDCHPAAGGLTGLLADRERCQQAAVSGVCYFDSVESLPHEEQRKLLEIIRTKRLGDAAVTARLCYSALPDLEERVMMGEFSAEVMTRISLMHLTILPLRERPDDIPPLARYYLKKYAALYHKHAADFTPEVWQDLIKHDWPYNLRDMDKFIGESVLAADGTQVTQEDVPFAVRQSVSLRRARHKFTYARIDALLGVYGHTTEGKRRAAKELGIGLSTLYRLQAKQDRERRISERQGEES